MRADSTLPWTRYFAAALLPVLGLLLAGCGGGAGPAPDPDLATAPATSARATALAAAAPAPARAGSALVADAGADLQAEPGQAVTLEGRVPAPGPASLLWTQVAGPPVQMSGATTARPRFTAPSGPGVTTLGFVLTVASGKVQASDGVTVRVVGDSPWGVAPSAALSYAPQNWVGDMALAHVRQVRGFDANPAVERLQPLTDAGMGVSGILMWSPTAPLSLPVADLDGWRRHVGAQVARFKGRVRHWEVWNEPPNFTADRSPQSYARVVAAACDAAKAVDPTVQIGLATKSNHLNWLAQAIEAGAADKFDFITLHPYESAALLQQGADGPFMGIVPRVRTMLLDKNPARAQVPVWFSEIGVPVAAPGAGGVSPEQQADLLAKIYTLALAQRVARVHWFDPRDSEGLHLGLSAADGTRRPAWFALQALAAALGPRPEYLGWLSIGADARAFAFAGPRGTVLVGWAPPGRSAVLKLVAPVTVVDLRSGAITATQSLTLTERPQLVLAPADSKQAQSWRGAAAASVGTAFPWPADHSRAAEVSLTAGRPHDGVMLIDAPPVTSAQGVAEFVFTGRSGPRFVVDPAFLSYTTRPIRITVRLRAMGSGDPGFNLKYESNLPIAQADGNGLVAASGGWHRVASTAVYERSWTITNPRFVGFYGYNFVLDSDGPAHAQFAIQRVTVTKL